MYLHRNESTHIHCCNNLDLRPAGYLVYAGIYSIINLWIGAEEVIRTQIFVDMTQNQHALNNNIQCWPNQGSWLWLSIPDNNLITFNINLICIWYFRLLMESTLEMAKDMRPKGKWGFYGFPRCYNYKGEAECSNKTTKAYNDQ